MRIFLGIIITLVCCAPTWSKNLYRFKDENGSLVIKDIMPPHLVPLGYTILNERGKVIEVVPPAKTPEQIAIDKAERKRAEELERERAIAEKAEALFLNSYTSPKDIIRTRQTQVSAVEVRRKIAQGNIDRLEDQIRRLRERAADFERDGKPLPDYINQQISDSIRQIDENKASIEEKIQIQNSIQDEFNQKLEQFQQIWSRNVVKTLQTKRKPTANTRVISSCDSAVQDCIPFWKTTVEYVKKHSTSGIEIEFENSIVSKPAVEQEDISVHAAMVHLIGETDMHFVLRVECKDSRRGDTLCASDTVAHILNDFTLDLKKP